MAGGRQRGQVYLDVLLSCAYRGWLWPGVAPHLASLAPQLPISLASLMFE